MRNPLQQIDVNPSLKTRKRIFIDAVVLEAFACALFLPTAIAKTPQQVFAQAAPHVVAVEMIDKHGRDAAQGSGIVMGQGTVVTTCDIVEKGKAARVRRSGKSFNAAPLKTQAHDNLCRLKVPELQSEPIALGTTKKLSIGERVFAIGARSEKEHKEGRDQKEGKERTKGKEVAPKLALEVATVTSLRSYNGAKYGRVSPPVSSGFGGGGLFDKEGNLLGILSPQVIQGEKLTFILPVDWIDESGKEKGQEAPAAAHGSNGLDWLNRALALEKKAEWRGLLKLSQQQVKRDPSNAIAWFNMGIASSNLEQYTQAVQAYREAIRNQAEYGDAWHKLGLAYVQLKDYENALQAYEDALRMQPHNAEAWYDLGNAYYDLKKYPHAIHAYRQALSIYPENPNAWYKLGITYDDLKLYDEAVKAYRKTVDIQPENADAWYKLGVDYATLDERGKIREIYQTLRELDPPRAEAYFNTYILP